MGKRSMYIWKLREVLAAEGNPAKIVAKAQLAKITALWVKVADGTSPYQNVGDEVAPDFRDLVTRA